MQDRLEKFSWIVPGFALILRAFYLQDFWAESPFSTALISDTAIFDRWARQIAGGDWLSGTNVFVLPPLYAYLLGLFYFVIGPILKAVQGLQILLGCISAWLVYGLGKRHFGTWAGLIGGVMFAWYGPELFYEGLLLGTSGSVLLCLLGLTALDRAGDTWPLTNHREWVLGGLVFGLAALVRPNVLSAVPFLLFGIWLHAKKQDQTVGYKSIGWVLVGLAIPLSVCGLRNGLVSGEWTPITAHGGINFYLGNHANAPGWRVTPPGMADEITPESIQGNLIGPRRLAEAALGKTMTASEVSDYWFGQGLQFWINQPLEAGQVLLRKVWLFFSGFEIPLNYNYYYQQQFSPLLRFSPIPLWLITPLALLGGVLAKRAIRQHSLLYLFLAGYALGVILFHVSTRYRMPAIPILTVFAGYGVSRLIEWVQQRQFKLLGTALVPLLLAMWIFRADALQKVDGTVYGFDAYNLGTRYLWDNQDAKALEYLEEAASYGDHYPSLYYNLALAYGRVGREEEAIQAYRKTLYQDPTIIRAYINLGNVYFKKGKYRQAIEVYEAGLKQDPNSVNARAYLGWAYFSLGNSIRARTEWQTVLRQAPGHESALAGMQQLRK